MCVDSLALSPPSAIDAVESLKPCEMATRMRHAHAAEVLQLGISLRIHLEHLLRLPPLYGSLALAAGGVDGVHRLQLDLALSPSPKLEVISVPSDMGADSTTRGDTAKGTITD
eukprot:CAMPEP_0171071044 /NCGR_PEP_ID=MMETSP0766_2-20121228/10100_1 /TAXON_ID=439317 /ORGANISM="Gambierdiscus australes, Strain CAWD 149" /LENGTH=112 /DNA_ID=CAMNT_0011527569 /DNA_START=183 /DNA_END=518 /DNA_ORIENTATION=-